MTREELISMGVSEESADKIMSEHGKAIQSANSKADKLKVQMVELQEKAGSVDELQKKIDEIEQQNLSELEKAVKRAEAAEQSTQKLQRDLSRSKITEVFALGGLSGDSYFGMIEALSSMDMEEAIKSANSFVSGISEAKKSELEAAKASWEAENLAKTPNPGGKKAQTPAEEKSAAAEYAKQYSQKMNPQLTTEPTTV